MDKQFRDHKKRKMPSGHPSLHLHAKFSVNNVDYIGLSKQSVTQFRSSAKKRMIYTTITVTNKLYICRSVHDPSRGGRNSGIYSIVLLTPFHFEAVSSRYQFLDFGRVEKAQSYLAVYNRLCYFTNATYQLIAEVSEFFKTGLIPPSQCDDFVILTKRKEKCSYRDWLGAAHLPDSASIGGDPAIYWHPVHRFGWQISQRFSRNLCTIYI